MHTGFELIITPANVLITLSIIWSIFVTFINLSNKQERLELEKILNDKIDQLDTKIDKRFDLNEANYKERDNLLEKRIVKLETIISIREINKRLDTLELYLSRKPE